MAAEDAVKYATMVARADAYLYARRQLGFQLRIEGRELLRFARFADSSGHRGALTTELALRWAQEATTATPLYRARRLEIVRCFAKHLAASEPATEIPPMGILGPAHRRTQPYIFDPSEISALVATARRLPSPRGLRGMTYASLIVYSRAPVSASRRHSGSVARTPISTPAYSRSGSPSSASRGSFLSIRPRGTSCVATWHGRTRSWGRLSGRHSSLERRVRRCPTPPCALSAGP